MRPMMRQKAGRAPPWGMTAARGRVIAMPASGTSAQAPMTPAKPIRPSKATPTGLPTAKAPYSPMPTSANTRPERCGPVIPKAQAMSPTVARLSPQPSSRRPAMMTA